MNSAPALTFSGAEISTVTKFPANENVELRRYKKIYISLNFIFIFKEYCMLQYTKILIYTKLLKIAFSLFDYNFNITHILIVF